MMPYVTAFLWSLAAWFVVVIIVVLLAGGLLLVVRAAGYPLTVPPGVEQDGVLEKG